MNREFDLTNKGQNPYSENGDIFMTNEGNMELPQNQGGEGQPQVNQPILTPEARDIIKRREEYLDGNLDIQISMEEIRRALMDNDIPEDEKILSDLATDNVGPLVDKLRDKLQAAWDAHFEEENRGREVSVDELASQETVKIAAMHDAILPPESSSPLGTEEIAVGEPPEVDENEEMRARMVPILEKLYESGDVQMGDIINDIPPAEWEQIGAFLSSVEAYASGSEDLQELDAKIEEYRRTNARFAELRDWDERIVQLGEGEISLLETTDGPRVFVPEKFYTKWRARQELQQLRATYEWLNRGESLGYNVQAFRTHLRNILDFTYPSSDSFMGEGRAGREDLSGRPAEAGGTGGGGERPPRRPTAAGGGEEPPGEIEFPDLRGYIAGINALTDSYLLEFVNQYEGQREILFGENFVSDQDRISRLTEKIVDRIGNPDVSADDKIKGRDIVEQLINLNATIQREIARRAETRAAAEEEARRNRGEEWEISRDPRINAAYKKILDAGTDPDARREAIMAALTTFSPHTAEFPSEFIDLALEDDEALDYLVNKIIAGPLDKETSSYKLGFYGGNSLDLLQDKLRTRAVSGDEEMRNEYRNKYEKVVLLSEAVQLGHELNAQIVTNNIEQFMRASGSITPEQLQVLQKINGVPVIMRLFDEEHSGMLARDGLIFKNNYDALFGLKKNTEGTITGRVDGTVVTRFKNYVDKAKRFGLPLPPEIVNLKPWEIDWAFKVNKILYNMNFRSAEQISTGHVPSGDEQFRSFPQESAARIMNPIGMTANRFGIGEDRGGEVLGQMTMDNFQEQREEDGYGHTSFTAMSGGRPISEFETSAMLGISGVFSSWRQNLVILTEVPILTRNADGTPAITLEMTNVRDQIKELLGDKPTAEIIERTFLENGELIENFNSSLALILKLRALTPDGEEDSRKVIDTKEKVRAAIWRRVARDNPLAMADFINGAEIRVPKSAEYPDGLRRIFLTNDGKDNGRGKDGRSKGMETWESLADKLTIVHEVRMEKIRSGELPTFDEVLMEIESKKIEGADALNLTEEERAMLTKIRGTGKELAGDLANVRFGYNPFMNDVLFEKMDYSNAGDEFLRRRVGGDFQSFSTAAPALMEIRNNPGFIEWEKAVEAEGKMIEGIASPNGLKDAKKRLKPFNRAYLSYIEKGGNVKNKVLKWLAKQSIYSTIREKLKKPTSIAQVKSGTGAHSMDEFGYNTIIQHQLHAGIISEEEAKKLRRKYGATFGGMFWAFIRDVAIISLGAGAAEFGKQTTSAKA